MVMNRLQKGLINSRIALRASRINCNSYFYIKCAKRVFFVYEKVFYAETKVEAV
jgi:hypothetical protein